MIVRSYLIPCYFILFRAFIELQDSIKIRKSCPGKKKLCYCYKVFSDDFRKHFYHRPQESLPDTRLGPLESRRVALSSHYTVKNEEFGLLFGGEIMGNITYGEFK